MNLHSTGHGEREPLLPIAWDPPGVSSESFVSWEPLNPGQTGTVTRKGPNVFEATNN